ncbi:MAG: aldo/keto reductase [bacterium]|nr:aldo/keto reductase [bacterium]MCP5068362.1 aldo/keto reductase [bacterium]
MRQRRLGRTGLTVSQIGIGTMTFGTMAEEGESLKILDRAFDGGVDFVDVAEIYPVPPDRSHAGRSEEICGKWLASKPRDAVILASKIAGPTGGWFQGPVRHGKTALDRHQIERAVEDSLGRLGTDYLDLYQVHWPDPGFPIEETLEGLDRVVEAGKVRAVGCSNESCAGLMESLWAADKHGTLRYQTIQNNFSLLNRRFEDELAGVCRKFDVSLLPYSPLAGGVLSCKYQEGEWPEGCRFTLYREHSPRTKAMVARFVNSRSLDAANRFAAVAFEHEIAPVTFAIAWTLAHDFVGSTLVGATDARQLDEVLAAAEVKLDPTALAACDAISKAVPYPLG